MTIADDIQLGLVVLAISVGLLGLLNRWAIANHRDRLASFTSAAGNAAGRIRETLAMLPPEADTRAVKATLIQAAATALVTEFDGTAKAIGATPAKAADIIAGQLGQIAGIVAILPMIAQPSAIQAPPSIPGTAA